MPVHNAERYLSEAIGSILSQTFSDFELIIINDGSTDRSLQIIQSFYDQRIKLISHPNRGLAASLNAGIKIARGKYIARMDADDISCPDRLSLQFYYMEQHPECVLSSGAVEYIDAEGVSLYTRSLPAEDIKIKAGLPLHVQIIHPACILQRAVFSKTSGYREDIKKHIEDILLWNELSELGLFANLKEVLLRYRISPGSITGHSRFCAMRKNRIVLKLLAKKQLSSRELRFLENLGKEPESGKKARYFWRLGLIYMSRRDYAAAVKNLKESLSCSFRLLTLYQYIKASYHLVLFGK
jgi:glycosyltransferase involved in cell wall biosynthesis